MQALKGTFQPLEQVNQHAGRHEAIKTLIECASRIFKAIGGLLHSLASDAPVHFVLGRLPLLLCQLVSCQPHRLSLCKCISYEAMQARQSHLAYGLILA